MPVVNRTVLVRVDGACISIRLDSRYSLEEFDRNLIPLRSLFKAGSVGEREKEERERDEPRFHSI